MIKKVVIVGGGFAGWYTACSLQHNIPDVELVVVESARHPIMSVGEVTTFDAPLNFKRLVGLEDDRAMMEATGAIYKYGSRAVDFYRDDSVTYSTKFPNLKVSSLTSFYNGFDFPDFQEPWNRKEGDIGLFMAWLAINKNKNRSYDDFIIETSEQYNFIKNPIVPYNDRGKYVLRNDGQSYAYHLDAAKTGIYLRDLLISRDKNQKVTNIVSTVANVKFAENDGCQVENITLENGQQISGDLFIDATGTLRAIIGKSTNDSFSPSPDYYNNACWAAPSKYSDPSTELIPVSEFCGEDWGWRFKVRLYHRIGNGYVFNTNMVDPEVTLARFKEVLGDTQLKEPNLIQWKPGQYLNPWQGNIIPLGLSAGLVDPYDAPTFEQHSKALDDLIPLILSKEPISQISVKYNALRAITREERNIRIDLTFGLSRRSGPFWESRREIMKDRNLIDEVKKIVLEQRPDLDARMNWHWHHIYARICMATGIDISAWEFPAMSAADQKMAEAFFAYNRSRNEYIGERKWPNYSEWLRINRFGGSTNQAVLEKLNPELCS